MVTRSKYRFLGGVGLIIGLNVYVGYSLWTMSPKAELNPFSVTCWQNPTLRVVMLFILLIQGLFAWLFTSQCKLICMSNEGLTFINPLFPFIRKHRRWSDYDCFKTIYERSFWFKHEAVWLIKDQHLKNRFSGIYYSNYDELKRHIKIPDKGELKISQYQQLKAWWGGKIE